MLRTTGASDLFKMLAAVVWFTAAIPEPTEGWARGGNCGVVSLTDSRRNLKQWTAYKTRVNELKTYIRIVFSKMSVIAYPGEENLVAVRFYQHYESSNFNWHGWKHLLWRRDAAGVWRILYEGNE
jgi:hypothetical protein